ncbi:hypothetical protein ACC691_36685, partial [Rhizobium johnstonii]|uniref:hypothetical protein n=1 Tax=Rhizobium johnstonii TaxID=3019933 RepID=UPI003F9DDD92
MPHDYPLHTDIEVRCLCCQSMQRFRFTSPSDHIVCEHCRAHLGDDKAERRDREHIALCRSITDAEQQSHRDDVDAAAGEASEASATIDSLRAQVD